MTHGERHTTKIGHNDATERLLTAVSIDERGAFERFYQLYYDQVFRFAYYCLGEREACKEVVSDVFFSVWKSKARLKDVANIETYLYTIVRNEALRYRAKREGRRETPMEDLTYLTADREYTDSAYHEETDPLEELIAEETENLLDQAIDELPERCRLIFLMAREEGMKPKEIAQVLQLSESTVRVQMKIAIERLVARLRPRFPHISFTLALAIIFS